jgi:histone deacetylase 1/2
MHPGSKTPCPVVVLFTYILVYVEDIVVAISSHQDVTRLVRGLHADFTLKDLRDLHYFMGIEVTRSGEEMVLSQVKYTSD